ncbi:MAG TPA: hypothetical protein VFH27_01660, partial [Longimicrobiaceae bacterium]|nr:hypothetical protein [Longimicrobiaceae bacterium]
IRECETNTATLCSTWERTDETHYAAQWPNGSVAVISVVRFDARYVDFRRDDPAGASAGMHAVYTADVVDGRLSRAIVVWMHEGQVFPGRWSATW